MCSQEFSPGDDEYDIGANRCCRETGNSLTIGTAATKDDGVTFEDFDPTAIPGLNISISDTKRYSRVATTYDLVNGSLASDYPALAAAPADECSTVCGTSSTLEKQFNTFSASAERTCCSKNWVRDFHLEDNGGGHAWAPSKMQNIPKESFRCYNWEPCIGAQCGDDAGDGINGFTCSHVTDVSDPRCQARQISESQAEVIFEWIEKFELVGIPQIAIEAGDNSEIACKVNPVDQSDNAIFVAGEYVLPPGLVKTFASEPGEYFDSSLNRRYSASDKDNFVDDSTNTIKRIFSADKVSCCLPAGTDMGSDTDANRCCTGFINGQTNQCALPDYTDVTLYLNKYVSSEASSRPNGSFDPETGYLINNEDVFQIACEKEICASGTLAPGISYSNLPINGLQSARYNRLLDGDYFVDENYSIFSDLYDRGLRWNNHYYCVPAPDGDADPLPGTRSCDQ